MSSAPLNAPRMVDGGEVSAILSYRAKAGEASGQARIIPGQIPYIDTVDCHPRKTDQRSVASAIDGTEMVGIGTRSSSSRQRASKSAKRSTANALHRNRGPLRSRDPAAARCVVRLPTRPIPGGRRTGPTVFAEEDGLAFAGRSPRLLLNAVLRDSIVAAKRSPEFTHWTANVYSY